MSAPSPEALWVRFQQLIEEGLSGRAAALRLKLSPATGVRWSPPCGSWLKSPNSTSTIHLDGHPALHRRRRRNYTTCADTRVC